MDNKTASPFSRTCKRESTQKEKNFEKQKLELDGEVLQSFSCESPWIKRKCIQNLNDSEDANNDTGISQNDGVDNSSIPIPNQNLVDQGNFSLRLACNSVIFASNFNFTHFLQLIIQ